MANFTSESVADALERSLKNAKHLRALDSGAVAAARALARKIDAWDVIVDWALEDVEERDGNPRPAVPANDNVSIASFLRYMEALGLTSPVEATSKTAGAPAAPASKVGGFRARAKAGPKTR